MGLHVDVWHVTRITPTGGITYMYTEQPSDAVSAVSRDRAQSAMVAHISRKAFHDFMLGRMSNIPV
jgi:hypothetical protein